MQFKLLPEDIATEIRVESLPHFDAHIKRLGFNPKQSFLLTRILRGLEHFGVRKNHSETADMLKSQSEIDATMVDSSYVLIKVFIWAIPILGFIGTVLGISDAVSSFGGDMGAERVLRARPSVCFCGRCRSLCDVRDHKALAVPDTSRPCPRRISRGEVSPERFRTHLFCA